MYLRLRGGLYVNTKKILWGRIRRSWLLWNLRGYVLELTFVSERPNYFRSLKNKKGKIRYNNLQELEIDRQELAKYGVETYREVGLE